MKAKNVTEAELHQTLTGLNTKYDNNIIFKTLAPVGRQFNFTLTVKDSAASGSRRSAGLSATGKYRRIAAACWHVHGDFFEALLAINPEVEIKSLDKTINIEGGNWEDWNAESQVAPRDISECCECNNLW